MTYLWLRQEKNKEDPVIQIEKDRHIVYQDRKANDFNPNQTDIAVLLVSIIFFAKIYSYLFLKVTKTIVFL